MRFPSLPCQDLCQGPEEHAVPGQLPRPQHEVPAGAADGEHAAPWGWVPGGTTACPQERSHQRGACTLSLAVSRYCGYSLPPKKGNNLFVTIQVSRNASCVGEPGEAHNGGLGCAQILGAVRVPLGTYGGRKQSLAMFWPFPPLQNPGGR